MSLPSPIDLLKRLKSGVGNFLFAIVVLLVVVPTIQWVLMIAGIVVAFWHWVAGLILFLLGAGGRYVAKNIRI